MTFIMQDAGEDLDVGEISYNDIDSFLLEILTDNIYQVEI